MEELKKIVAANLTALRTAKGMTQLELGEMISYSDKAISKWERGESIPDALVLLKLSRIFGCTVDYLLTEHSEEEAKPAVTAQKPRTNHLNLSLVTIIGIWMLLRELSPTSGRRPLYRPDRTPQEMEYVAVREYRAHEKAMREANGEEHRMPQRGKKTALLAMDIGMFLSVLLPDVVLMFLA